MSLEELWKLFPIILSPHNPEWKRWADNEIQSLSILLADFTTTINHIGSTAVPGIMAKSLHQLSEIILGEREYGLIIHKISLILEVLKIQPSLIFV